MAFLSRNLLEIISVESFYKSSLNEEPMGAQWGGRCHFSQNDLKLSSQQDQNTPIHVVLTVTGFKSEQKQIQKLHLQLHKPAVSVEKKTPDRMLIKGVNFCVIFLYDGQ